MKKTIERESWSSTIEQEKANMQIGWDRQATIELELSSLFPEDVNARFYFDSSAHRLLRMWISITPMYDEAGKKIEADPLETSALKMMAQAYTGLLGEKNIRKESGSIYWVYRQQRKDNQGDFEFWILIENAHPMTCKITKVVKEVEQFEMNCTD